MNIIKPGTRIDFVAIQKPFLMVSGVFVLASIILLFVPGLNFGVDFKGGSELILRFDQPVDANAVREATETVGFEGADVQSFGDSSENRFLIRIPRISTLSDASVKKLEELLVADVGKIKRISWSEEGGDVIYVRFEGGAVDKAKVSEAAAKAELGNFEVTVRGDGERAEYQLRLQELQVRVAERFGEIFNKEQATFNVATGIERVETVGPRVGQQLRGDGIASLLVSLLFILIYIAFRFDIRYAPGAVVALLHDVMITLGAYAALQMEVSLPIIAALLTIVGYSLNDTIVIFDRIRENFENLAGQPVEEIVNKSINESLSRTLLTSVTTLLAVLALFFFGGGLIQNFAFALIVGVIVGTYSSTFIAAPILIAMHHWVEARQKAQADLNQRSQDNLDVNV